LTFSFTPSCQGESQTKHDSSHVWHDQLAHARDTPSCASTPKARGLRHGESSPCGRRDRPPTPTPHPPLLSGIGMASGVSPVLLSTSLHILGEASRVQQRRLRGNDTGGVFISLPRPLCAAPQSLDLG
jgi:hypothetical protein